MTDSKLKQLARVTTVVADTGDMDAIRQYQPVDATTNPSLLLKAVTSGKYQSLVDQALGHAQSAGVADMDGAIEYLSVIAGLQILSLVPGRVSTEVNAKYSFDVQATVDAATRLIDLYAARGISSQRILIKIAATWEGIQAAERLERMGIQCNLTLLFSEIQARACADAGVFLISPFVGRITDWHKAQTGVTEYLAAEDPGVQSVKRIYRHYKAHGYQTIVMGASFRNAGQVEALAGCDRLTISPQLLDALASDEGHLPIALSAAAMTTDATHLNAPVTVNRAGFESAMRDDAMASEKLASGIDQFVADTDSLAGLLVRESTSASGVVR